MKQLSKYLFSTNYKIIILLLFLSFGTLNKGIGQSANTLYHMPVLPQSGYMNPAAIPEYSFYFGLPALGGIHTNVGNNFLSYNNIFINHPNHASPITFVHPDADQEEFIGKLREMNRISPELSLNALMFGIKAGKSFFSFQIAERSSLKASLPRDIIELGLMGTDHFAGRTADFSNFEIDFSHFREYSLGFSTKINDLVQVGVRGKMLFGKGNIQLANRDMSIYTDPDTYEMMLRAKLSLNMSAPLSIQYDSLGNFNGLELDEENFDPLKYMVSSQNMGFAFDAGVIIKPFPRLALSASVVDFGFINWQRDVKNISMDGEFEFEGFDFSTFYEDGNEDNPINLLLDSLTKVFEITDTQDSYRTGLGTKIYVGANYLLTKGINVGLLSRSEIYRNKLMQSVALSANFQVGSGLSTSLSYSIHNNTYDNIGLGLGFRGGPFLLYLVSDNVTGFFFPKRAQTVNFLFGLNFVFGYNIDKKKKESQPFF